MSMSLIMIIRSVPFVCLVYATLQNSPTFCEQSVKVCEVMINIVMCKNKLM